VRAIRSRLDDPFAERDARKVVLAVSLTVEQAAALDRLVERRGLPDRSKLVKALLSEEWRRSGKALAATPATIGSALATLTPAEIHRGFVIDVAPSPEPTAGAADERSSS
jgi:Arc/MetJ-type ribon-helix-helix transcriptional regulator